MDVESICYCENLYFLIIVNLAVKTDKMLFCKALVALMHGYL